MYAVVLLAALCGAEEAPSLAPKHCPPVLDGGGYPGYHNPGGWGQPYGGYGWTGYYCPAYQHVGPPAVSIPPEPLFVPPPPRREDEPDDEEDVAPKDDKGGPKKKDDKADGEAAGGTADVAKYGLALVNLTPSRRKLLRLPDDAVGAAVAGAKGVADKSGVQQGMLIVSVNGDPVTTAKQAADLINKASLREGISLRVVDGQGQRSTIVLKK
jgi:hypothetical protein